MQEERRKTGDFYHFSGALKQEYAVANREEFIGGFM